MMRQHCRVRVGFFSLRDCESAPIAQCTSCSRPMCEKHSVSDNEGILCSECAAKRSEASDEWNRGTFYGHRRGYYSRGYSPWYFGHHHHHHRHYDEYDTRNFDEREAEAEEALAAEEGGFFDS